MQGQGQNTPATYLAAGHTAFMGCRFDTFKSVLGATLDELRNAVVQHDRQQAQLPRPDEAITAATLEAMRGKVEFMRALVSLPQDDARALHGAFDPINPPLTQMQTAVIARHPALAAWQAEREQRGAEADRHARERQEQQRAAHETAEAFRRSGDVLAALRRVASAGITLTVHGGALKAHPGALLTGEDREVLREYRAELVALLREPAEVIAA